MSIDAGIPLDADLERHIDESLLQDINSSASASPSLTRVQPGAVLLSPQAMSQTTPITLLSPQPLSDVGNSGGIISPVTTNSNMALLSPPGSRYAFENDNIIPTSPLLGSNSNPLIGNFNNTSIQRPLSAQSFNVASNNNHDSFDAFRPFSAQGTFNVPERPLSSMEIDSITFKSDVGNLINWINTLNSNQHKVVIDNLFDNLPIDVLNYARDKLKYSISDNNNLHPQQQNSFFHQQNSLQEPVTLDSILHGGIVQPTPLEVPTAIHLQRALSPNFPSFDRNALLHDVSSNRPRSADPYSKLNKNHEINRTPSRNRRNDENSTFDITNLAQQLSTTPIKVDYNNSNNLKLSALSTINSRVQLDSLKKRSEPPRPNSGGGYNNNNVQHAYNITEELNKISPSGQQVPRVNYYETISNSPSMNRVINKQINRNSGNFSNNNDPELARLASLNSAVKNLSFNEAGQGNEYHTPYKQNPHHNNNNSNNNNNNSPNNNSTPKSPAINPKQISNPKLLNDIPSWLKSLRLHKYTQALQDIPWKELIYLDDKQLEEKGVSAMGARGKLLKAFEVVKQHYEGGLIKE